MSRLIQIGSRPHHWGRDPNPISVFENPQQPLQAPRERGISQAGFLDLPAEVRNAIYEMHFRLHNRVNSEVVICNEKGPRDVPSALSRTCQQVRAETLVYFFEDTTVRFIMTSEAHYAACREWIRFIPDMAFPKIKSIYIKYRHNDSMVLDGGGWWRGCEKCNFECHINLDGFSELATFSGCKGVDCRRAARGYLDGPPLEDPQAELIRMMVANLEPSRDGRREVSREIVLMIFDILEPVLKLS